MKFIVPPTAEQVKFLRDVCNEVKQMLDPNDNPTLLTDEYFGGVDFTIDTIQTRVGGYFSHHSLNQLGDTNKEELVNEMFTRIDRRCTELKETYNDPEYREYR